MLCHVSYIEIWKSLFTQYDHTCPSEFQGPLHVWYGMNPNQFLFYATFQKSKQQNKPCFKSILQPFLSNQLFNSYYITCITLLSVHVHLSNEINTTCIRPSFKATELSIRQSEY